MNTIVITGMGAVTPIGTTQPRILESLRALLSGLVHCGAPDDRALFGRTTRNLRGGKYRKYVGDWATPFALCAAETAVRNAGLKVAPYPAERCAVIASSSKGQLWNLILANELLAPVNGRRLSDGQNRRLFGNLFSVWTGDQVSLAVARKLHWSGPALNYAAACATGAISIIAGVNLLQGGLADAVIAGSSEASGHPLILGAFENMGALSGGRARPFHRERDGFNAGEGAGLFVLERECDAQHRGAKPLARIAGWDFRSDAHHMTGVNPDGAALEYSIRLALSRADWRPDDVEYINAHGTGTRQNDEVEAAVISRVFGKSRPLVSSLKPYVGHLLGASASVELALALTAFHDGFIPPTLQLDDPDPRFHLNFVPEKGIEVSVRRWIKLSLGFGGHIAVLALENIN